LLALSAPEPRIKRRAGKNTEATKPPPLSRVQYQTELERIKVEKAKIELDLMRKNVFHRDDIENFLFTVLRTHRDSLKKMIDANTAILFACDTQHELSEHLHNVLNEVLTEFADNPVYPGRDVDKTIKDAG